MEFIRFDVSSVIHLFNIISVEIVQALGLCFMSIQACFGREVWSNKDQS